MSAICDVNVKPVEGNISPNYGFKWYSASMFDHCNGLEMACPPWNMYIYIYAHTCILYFRSGISIDEISKGFKTYVIHDKRVILKANGSAETQPNNG